MQLERNKPGVRVLCGLTLVNCKPIAVFLLSTAAIVRTSRAGDILVQHAEHGCFDCQIFPCPCWNDDDSNRVTLLQKRHVCCLASINGTPRDRCHEFWTNLNNFTSQILLFLYRKKNQSIGHHERLVDVTELNRFADKCPRNPCGHKSEVCSRI